MNRPKHISHLSEITENYAIVLCDVWGVVHNGRESFHGARQALSAFQARPDRQVILLTNAPRPSAEIHIQLQRLGVTRASYADIVTSGDVTRYIIEKQVAKANKAYFIGPERDKSLFQGLDVCLVEAGEADFVICSGLFDDTCETPEDYREILNVCLKRDLLLVCANPDIVVRRGDKMIYCGGSLAKFYRELGGHILLSGKPYGEIYEKAVQVAQGLLARKVEKHEILAIGDGLHTDILGANKAGIDTLLITGGIHEKQFGAQGAPSLEKVEATLKSHDLQAVAYMSHLE